MKYFSIIFTLFLFSIGLLQAQDTMDVNAGWNIIGAMSTRAVSDIGSRPNGIISSLYYGYQSGVGYQQTDTLKRGKGYWVKASEAGLLLSDYSGPGCPTSVEYSGKTYTIIEIGSQCWFKENLDVGTRINGTVDQTDNSTLEKYCYNDNASNCTIYGGLYEWDETMQYSTTEGAQGICPEGWHVPSQADINTLRTSVASDGNALKEVGQGTGGGAGTNTSGFSALLSGAHSFTGSYISLGSYFGFWSSWEHINGTHAAAGQLFGEDSNFLNGAFSKGYAYSVRCLKD